MIKSNYIEKSIRLLVSSFAVFGLMTFMACESEKKEPTPLVKDPDKDNEKPVFQQTIAEYLTKRNEFSLLVSQLERFNLMDALEDTSANAKNFTLFAPNDGGVNAYIAKKGFTSSAEFLAALNADALNFHLLNGRVESSSISTGKIKASNGREIFTYLSTASGLHLNGSSKVILADIKLKNGIIHVINEMIEPIQPKTILEELTQRGNFKNFLALLRELKLDSLLNDTTGAYTVFAPNDAAFARSSSYLNTLPSVAFRNDVIRYHILNESKFTHEFRDEAVQSLHQRNKSVILRDGFPNRANDLVLRTDSINIFALNGVLHIVDEVLRPSVQVSDILFYNPDYSSFYEALNRSGLLLEIDRSNFVTLFALNNQRVAEGLSYMGYPLGLDDPMLRQDTLINLLRYHTIFGNRIGVGSISNNYLKMSNGDYIYTNRNGNDITITDASRLGTSRLLSSESGVNGVVHFIDRGLEPARKTFFDLVSVSPSHRVLDSIIRYSDELGRSTNLKTILQNRSNKFLFFAPSDQNFNALFGLLKTKRNSLSSVDSAVWYTQNKGTKELDTLIDIVRTMLVPATPILVQNLPEGFNKVRTLEGYEIVINNRIVQLNRVIEAQGELVGPAQRRSGGRIVQTAPLETNWQATNGMIMPFEATALPITRYPFWR
jgi:transforming growth factor-beta-induced protein